MNDRAISPRQNLLLAVKELAVPNLHVKFVRPDILQRSRTHLRLNLKFRRRLDGYL